MDRREPDSCGAEVGAFAAGLQCPRGGCGQCTECRTSLSGAHPDVTLVRTEMLSIGIDEVRELVRSSALAPVGDRWQALAERWAAACGSRQVLLAGPRSFCAGVERAIECGVEPGRVVNTRSADDLLAWTGA